MNDEVDLNKANTAVKAAAQIINSCKVEVIHNQINGTVGQLDFMVKPKPQLGNEFASELYSSSKKRTG
jgi:hypothetical protein